MQVRTRHTPAFGVARLLLAPGEAVQADYASLIATSYGVIVDVRPRGSVSVRVSSCDSPALGPVRRHVSGNHQK